MRRTTSTPGEIAAEFPNGATTPAPVSVMSTSRTGSPAEGTVIETAAGQPDIILTVMTPLAQVVVRGLRTYLQGLAGFLAVVLANRTVLEGVGVTVPPGDFLAALQTAAGLAVAPTVISLIWNTIELLGQLDNRFPKARA